MRSWQRISAGAALLALTGCMGYDEIEAQPEVRLNNRPYIESATPSPGIITLQRGSTQRFSITVRDPDGDRFFGYRWKLNGTVQGNGSFYSYTGTSANALDELVVTVWDCPGVGLNNDFTGLEDCQFEPPDPASTIDESWAIKVEPEG